MPAPDLAFTGIDIVRVRDGKSERVRDVLAVEEPLEIRLGYTDPRKGRVHRSISITMRTPGDDEALALGFLYAERIIRSEAAVVAVDATNANVIRLELDDKAVFDPARLERHFYTTSSCGVCGKASLESLSLAGFDALHDDFRIRAAALHGLAASIRSEQALFQLTGGNHATAVFDREGRIELITEDVGRHNAMDKLVGHLLRRGELPLAGRGILVSGRASFELLQKALAAGCPLLVAVGAPSSLAVELAQEFNVSLVGFLGEYRLNIYHGAERIKV